MAGAIVRAIRALGTLLIKGDEIAAPIIKQVAKKEISIFDAAKNATSAIKSYANVEKNRILPANPLPKIREYWNKYHGTDKFSWIDMFKEGKIMQWLVPAGLILPEVGNLYRSFTDEQGGLITGTLETGKTTARVTAGAIGGILGSLIPVPVLGPLIGYMVGDWAMGRIVGKTFTDQISSSGNGHSGGSFPGETAQTDVTQNAAETAQTDAGAQKTAQQTVTPDYSALANNFRYNFNNPFSSGLTSYNSYADDYMTKFIFGNQQTSSIPTLNTNLNFNGFTQPSFNYLS